MLSRTLSILSICALLTGVAQAQERPWFEFPPVAFMPEIKWIQNARLGTRNTTSTLVVSGPGQICTLSPNGQTSSPIYPFGVTSRVPPNFAIGSVSGSLDNPSPWLFAVPGAPSPITEMMVFDFGPPPRALGGTSGIPGIGAGLLVTMGNVVGDATSEMFLTPLPGVPSIVHVIEFNRDDVITFAPFGDDFQGGVRMAAGDVNGDGFAELFTTQANGPGFKVWTFPDGQPREVASGFPFGPTMPGGIWSTALDINNDGVAEIIAGTGPGSGQPRIRIFDVTGPSSTVVADFFAFDPTFAGGVFVSAGLIDGQPVVAAASGPRVSVFKLFENQAPVPAERLFFSYTPFGDVGNNTEVRVQFFTPPQPKQ